MRPSFQSWGKPPANLVEVTDARLGDAPDAASRWVELGMDRVMRWALSRWTRLQAVDYADLLNLSGPYRVCELEVEQKH